LRSLWAKAASSSSKKSEFASGGCLYEVQNRSGQALDRATWLHKAREMPKEQFKQEVEKELTGRN
jgi:hypothetical protein